MNHEENNHVAFNYGYHLAKLEDYARDNGISQSILTERMAQLLLGTGKRTVDRLPILPPGSPAGAKQLSEVAVAGSARDEARLRIPCPKCKIHYQTKGLHMHLFRAHKLPMERAVKLSRKARS